MVQPGSASYITRNFWSLYGIQLQVLGRMPQTELQDFVNQFLAMQRILATSTESQTSPVLNNQDTYMR